MNSNFQKILKRIFLKMQMWTGYIVSPLTERKKMFIEVEREMAKYDIIAGKIADDATKRYSYRLSCGCFWDCR